MHDTQNNYNAKYELFNSNKIKIYGNSIELGHEIIGANVGANGANVGATLAPLAPMLAPLAPMAPIRWRSWRHVALLGAIGANCAKIGALDWRQPWRQFLGANGALLVSANVDWRHVAPLAPRLAPLAPMLAPIYCLLLFVQP